MLCGRLQRLTPVRPFMSQKVLTRTRQSNMPIEKSICGMCKNFAFGMKICFVETSIEQAQQYVMGTHGSSICKGIREGLF